MLVNLEDRFNKHKKQKLDDKIVTDREVKHDQPTH